jgi:hypothetical protein
MTGLRFAALRDHPISVLGELCSRCPPEQDFEGDARLLFGEVISKSSTAMRGIRDTGGS